MTIAPFTSYRNASRLRMSSSPPPPPHEDEQGDRERRETTAFLWLSFETDSSTILTYDAMILRQQNQYHLIIIFILHFSLFLLTFQAVFQKGDDTTRDCDVSLRNVLDSLCLCLSSSSRIETFLVVMVLASIFFYPVEIHHFVVWQDMVLG